MICQVLRRFLVTLDAAVDCQTLFRFDSHSRLNQPSNEYDMFRTFLPSTHLVYLNGLIGRGGEFKYLTVPDRGYLHLFC